MRNLIDESPFDEQHGRTLFTRAFVPEEDLVGKDVLDVGCGFGAFVRHAVSAGASSVTGVEPTESDLATARTYLSGSARFEVASADALPFDAAAFDTVTLWEVLEHVPAGAEARVLREVARVLRPGGRLFLSTPFASVASRVTDPAWWLTRHRHYSHADLRRLAEQSGLAAERIEVRGGTWQTVFMLDLYVSKWLLRRPPVGGGWMEPRVDAEWCRDGGFTNVFLQCRNPT